MSDTNQELTMSQDKPATLPLKGEKQPTIKIVAIMVLLIIIVGVNFIIVNHGKNKTVAKKENEVFDFTYAKPNPISQLPVSHPQTNDNKLNADKIAEEELKKKLAEEKAKDFIERLQASQHLSGNGTYAEFSNTSNQAGNNNNVSPSFSNEPAHISDPNTAFLQQASNSKAEHVYATHYGRLPYLIGQGKFIFANLAVAINSDLPGQLSATVSQDVYGDQGRKILIPKGSLLIGEYKSGLVNNQSRLFVAWTRVREPNGIDVMLGSEGTDELGRAGLTGNVDDHFFARFGSAFLIAMIGAGASTVGVHPDDQNNSSATYRENVTQALAQQANNTLNQNINIPPTINIPQGQKIVVFVNRDLDFSRVMR